MDDIRNSRLERLQKAQNQAARPATADSRPNTAPPDPQSPAPAASPAPTPPQKQSKPVSPEAKISAILSRVFKVSLDHNQQSLIYLPSLDGDKMDGDSKLLSLEDIDSILWEALTAAKEPVFEYLFGCYDRLRSAIRIAKSPDQQQLQTLEQSLASYAVVCATADPNEELHGNLAAYLLSSSTVSWPFVSAIIASAVSQEMLDDLMNPVWADLLTALIQRNIRGEYAKVLSVTENLLTIKDVALNVVSRDDFDVPADISPRDICTRTWLGVFFSISSLDNSFPAHLFSGVGDDLSKNNVRVEAVIKNSMPETMFVMNQLFAICDKLVRASLSARQKVLNFFARVLDKNHKRMASFHVDAKTVCPDGFMANLSFVTVKFCLPFVDLTGSKLDKIDLAYFKYKDANDVDEETKLVADLETSREILNPKTDAPPNFITQIFFLAIGFLQYGLGGIYQSQTRLKRARSYMNEQLERIEGMSAQRTLPHIQLAVQRARNEAIRIKTDVLALNFVLQNEELMSTFYEFAVFVLIFTIHQIQKSYPKQALKFDAVLNTSEPPDLFKALPEYVIESLVSTLIYVGRSIPQIPNRNTHPQIIEGIVLFLRCPQYIKNPYLKSKLVEVLFYGTMTQRTTAGTSLPGYFADTLRVNPTCQKHLFHSLMKMYIDMEQTGRSAQFYEKFHTRELISLIMQVLWENPVYQRNLEEESTKNSDFFVKFVALLLNDSTYLIDEALGKLQEIHSLQIEVENNPTPLDQQQQRQEASQNEDENDQNRTPEERLQSAEGSAKNFLELSKGCIDLLRTFTSAVPEPFVNAIIVDRIASMLNYNLNVMVGPKSRQLKVRDPAKYGWNPREMLTNIIRVYLNLESFEPFIVAVARDAGSFGVGNFEKAQGILTRNKLLPDADLAKWKKMTSLVTRAAQEDEDDEDDDDIPDEFMDPILFTLMEDPVILPSSKVTVDRSTIQGHLLSDATDPFNRSHLTLEDVIPNTELKARIEEYKQARREQRT